MCLGENSVSLWLYVCMLCKSFVIYGLSACAVLLCWVVEIDCFTCFVSIQYISRQVLVVLYEGCVHSTQFWVVCFHQEKDPIQFKYPKQIPENACWSFQLLHIKNLCKRQIDARQDRINCLLTSTTLGNVNFCKIILNILSFSHSYSKFMLSQNPPNTKTVIKIDINGPKDKTVL